MLRLGLRCLSMGGGREALAVSGRELLPSDTEKGREAGVVWCEAFEAVRSGMGNERATGLVLVCAMGFGGLNE